ncbi:MAG: hypothetical protein ACRCS8_00670 [Brevinema sp.]
MGITCSMLVKEDSNIKATSLYATLKKICSDGNLIIGVNIKEVDETDRVKLIRTNISDVPLDKDSSRQLCVDIFDEPYKFKYNSFEWFDESISFFESIVIDYFDRNEDLLFRIVHDLLKQYPKAKLWIEEDWFYTLEDLDKINNKAFNKDWCYKNPKDF